MAKHIIISDDYLFHSGNYKRLFQYRYTEVPTIIRKNGKYFIIASGYTGWNPNAAKPASAENIFSLWTELGNLCIGENINSTFNLQGTFILKVKNTENYIFMTYRWKPSNPIEGK